MKEYLKSTYELSVFLFYLTIIAIVLWVGLIVLIAIKSLIVFGGFVGFAFIVYLVGMLVGKWIGVK